MGGSRGGKATILHKRKFLFEQTIRYPEEKHTQKEMAVQKL